MSDDVFGYSLVLPFDSDEPEFRRGVEAGILWQRLAQEPDIQTTIHADNAEMVIRIAESRGLPFAAEPLGDDWLSVRIGYSIPEPVHE